MTSRFAGRRLAGRSLAAVLLLLVGGGGVAGQQSFFTLGPRDDTPEARRLVFQTDATPAARRPGGFGWISVEATNPDQSVHEAEILLRQSSRPLTTTTLRLEPGERARIVLPLPYTDWASRLEISVDGGPRADTNIQHLPPGSTTSLPSLLALTDDAGLGATLRSSAESAFPILVDGGTLTGFIVKRASDLPDRWQMLSGFDAIVLDARSPALEAGRQQVLADYVAAGGRLVVGWPADALDGPLGAMLATGAPGGASVRALDTGARGRHGFGQWMAATSDEALLGQQVVAWLSEPALVGQARTFSGLPQDGLGSHLVIPGVGEVPKSGFLLLIIVFVLAIAATAVHQFKRRQHGRLLVLVPGTGLAFTGAMLAYGFFSEGLGVQGVVRSVTLLDQRSHEAVDIAQRSLYAGMQPATLPLAAGTLLVSWDQFRLSEGERMHRLQLDTSAGWVADGAALPSRLPTHLATVTVSRPRERLRLRRTGQQRLEVLPDASLAPKEGANTLLLRDFHGVWWASGTDGGLHPIDGQETDARLAERRHGLWRMKTTAGPGGGDPRFFSIPAAGSPHEVAAQQELSAWLETFLSADAPPGSYVALVESDPCVDALGLDVRWVDAEHLVVGRLAEEDLLE